MRSVFWGQRDMVVRQAFVPGINIFCIFAKRAIFILEKIFREFLY